MNKQSNSQFSLLSLLLVVSYSAIALGVTAWVLKSHHLQAQTWFPTLFLPLPLLKLSVVGGPLVALILLFATFWQWAICRPLPIAPLLFLTCIGTMFVAPPPAELRLLLALLAGTITLYAVARLRQLPKPAFVAASLCLGITICYYVTISSLLAGAYV